MFFLSIGCASSHRPSPYAAFDMMAQRSLADDADYVKRHLAPELVVLMNEDGSETADLDPHLRSLMNRLQRFKCLDPTLRVDGDETVIEVFGTDPDSASGSLLRCRYRLLYDDERGWLLASRSFDDQPFVHFDEKGS